MITNEIDQQNIAMSHKHDSQRECRAELVNRKM